MTSPAPVSVPVTPGMRLGNGELRRMVARVLADDPGTEFGPRAISKLTGRSSGAIGNALEVLVRDGHADRTQDAPRRYRANADTASAAAAAPAPPAATPAPAAAARYGRTAPP